MNTVMYIYTLFGLSLLGTLFSGYLSGVKLFTNTCAFGEGCPLFLGYPACYFGFLLFFILLVTIVFGVFQKITYKTTTKIMTTVSLIGIMFAGRYVFLEISSVFSKGFYASMLGLPTCAYGLAFFILICAVSILFSRKAQ